MSAWLHTLLPDWRIIRQHKNFNPIKDILPYVLPIGTNAGKKRGRGKAKGINAGDGEIEVEIYDGKRVTYCYVDLLKLIMVS